jgi:hypothetical protein
MQLQNLQSELVDLIFYEGPTGGFIQQAPYLNIYRNNILSNLEKTLKAIYPLIQRITGPGFFDLLVKDYIKNYPSRSSNLHDFGEYFSDFLMEYGPAKSLPYLSEVATFEWMHHVLYFAAGHPGLDLSILEKISPNQYESLHFVLNPASFLKQFHCPILRIIELCEEEIDTDVHLDEGGVSLLIIRRDFNNVLLELSPPDFVFLDAVAHNHSLAQCLQAAVAVDECFDLTEKLLHWIKNKTIVECFLE